jgi:thiamine transport system permease protein
MTRRVLYWLAPSLFLLLFFFYPLIRVLLLSIRTETETFSILASLPEYLNVLLFTFFQASLSTLLTLLVGIPIAFLFSHFEFHGKPFLRALTAVPFMLPTVVVAAGFTALLGPRGWVNLALMSLFNLTVPPITFVGTLTAILIAHVFYNSTIVIRLVGNSWAQLDPRLDQAARVLGADSKTVQTRITLPLLRPSLLAAILLVFLFDFTSFGVILLLGGTQFRTLEVEIYIQAMHFLNLPAAAILSMIQLLCTLIFSMIYSRVVTRSIVPLNPRSGSLNLKPAKSLREKLFVRFASIFIIVLFVLPLVALPVRSLVRLEPDRGERGTVQPAFTLNNYRELTINRSGSLFYVPPMDALRNSLVYAVITVILSLLLGFPAASALARPSRLEKIVDPFLMLPLGASAVTLGLGYILAFNRWLYSPLLVPLAHTTLALPFVIRSLQPALASIPQRLREAASVLGATPRQVWRSVDLPIISRALTAAGVFAFTVSLGEFGATAMLVRPEYPTMTTAIARFLSLPGGLNYGQAMAMATILLLVTTTAILIIEKIRLPGSGEF